MGALKSATEEHFMRGFANVNRAALVLGLSSVFALAGCQDDGAPSPEPTLDTAKDALDQGDANGGAGDAGDGSIDGPGDGGDVETDVPTGGDTSAAPPALACQVRLRSGLSAFGPPTEFSLADADEPADYVASPGFQLDFSAITTNIPSGAAIRLVVDGTRADTLTLAAPSAGNGQVVFANVTLLTSAEIAIEVTVGGELLRCEPTTFAVDSEKCSIEVEPAAGCLTNDASADPGTQLAFTVKNPDGRCSRGQLSYRIGGEETVLPAADLGLAGAPFSFTVDAGLADGLAFDVKATVSNPTISLRTHETAWLAYQADVRPPEVSLEAPVAGALIVPSDDEDGDLSNGIQLPVTGSVVGLPESGSIVTVTDSVTGQSVTATILGSGTTRTWKAVLGFPASVGNTTITASTSDGCGNAATASSEGVSVALTLPAGLTIVAPLDGAVLSPSADGDPATPLIYETSFTVLAVNVPVGSSIEVECRDSAPDATYMKVGSAQLASVTEALTIPVAISAQTDTEKVCRVFVAGTGAASGPMVTLSIPLPPPSLRIVSPEPGTFTSQPTLPVLAAASGLEGQTVVLTVSGPEGVVYAIDSAVVSGGVASVQAALTANGAADGARLADGAYTVSLSAVDELGTAACANPESACAISVIFDSTPPALSISAPSKLTLTPALDADSNAELPGYQIAVTVGLVEAGGAELSVCLAVSGTAVRCATAAPGAVELTFTDITLQPGQNAIEVTATDAAGNVASPATRAVRLTLDAPAVVIVTPDTDRSVIDPAVTFEVDVLDADGDAFAPEAVSLEVSVDAGDYTSPALVDLGGGRFGFVITFSAEPGSHTVIARAAVDGGPAGFSAPRTIVVKAPPSLVVSGFTDGSVLNRAASNCLALDGDCVTDVTCAGTDLDDGSAVTLTSTCGGSAASASATAVSGVANFPAVSLTNGTTCTLSCSAVDAGTLTQVDSAPITVEVDRTAPVFGAFTAPFKDALTFREDESLDAGFQLVVALTAGGFEAGQVATLTASWDGGSATRTVVLDVGTPDGTSADLIFPSLDLPDGTVTLTVTAADAAGNLASASLTVLVSSQRPVISIISPLDGAILAPSADGDKSTALLYETQFSVSVTGVAAGDVIAVECRNADPAARFFAAGSTILASAVAQGASPETLLIPVVISAEAGIQKVCRVFVAGTNPFGAPFVNLTVPLPPPVLSIAMLLPGSITREVLATAMAFATGLDGRSVVISATGPSGQKVVGTPVVVADGVVVAAIGLTVDGTPDGAPLPDGEYRIELEATDAFGTSACEAAASLCAMSIVLDRTAPALTITAPTKTKLTPEVDPDASALLPGYQTDVVVDLVEAGGPELEVCLTTAGQPFGCVTAPDGARSVRFADVTLQPGKTALVATATDAAGNIADPASSSVELVTEGPAVTVVSPATDVSVVDPAVTLVASVRDMAGQPLSSGVAFTISIDGGVFVPVTPAALGDGQWELAVVLPAEVGIHSVVVGATADVGPAGYSAARAFRLKGAPRVALSAPADGAVFNLASSACLGLPGDCISSVTCAGTDLDDGSTVTLTSTCAGSVVSASAPIASGIATFSAVRLLNDTVCTLSCDAVDLGTSLLAQSDVTSIQVDRTSPVFTSFVAPAGAVLTYAEDGSFATPGLQYVVSVKAGGYEAGQELTLTASWADGRTTRRITLGSAIADGAEAVVEFPSLDLPAGEIELTVIGADQAGNASSISQLVTVDLTPPPLSRFVLTAPADGTVTNGDAVTLAATAERLDGVTGTVTVVNASGDTVFVTPSSAVAAGSFSQSIPLTVDGLPGSAALADGAYTIRVALVDQYGRPACDSPDSSCSTSFTLDRTSPALAFTSPTATTLTTPKDVDSSPTMPGFQTQIVLSVSDAGPGATVEVCLDTAGCQAVASGGVATFDDVTLQPGANTLSARATDSASNEANASWSVVLVADGPAVVIEVPAQDLVVVDPQVSFTAAVRTADGEPVVGIVALWTSVDGGAFEPVTGTPAGASTFQFPITLPAFGIHTVVVQATVNGGTPGASSARSVRYKDVPAIAVSSPAGGSVQNLASSSCQALESDCVTDVTCSATDLDDGSAATLTVDCGSGPSLYSGTPTGGALNFASVVLDDGSTCSLTCEATDSGTGIVARSAVTTVSVDRTAPVLGPFAAPSVDTLTIYDLEAGPTGPSYDVKLAAGGFENGQVLTLTGTWTTGSLTRSIALGQALPDGTTAEVTFDAVTFPLAASTSTTVTLTVTGTDLAGNPASASRDVIIDLVPGPATLALTSPSWGATLFAVGDENPSTPTVYDSSFAVDVSRGTVGATVTLSCRDAGTTGAFSPVGAASVVADGALLIPVQIPVIASVEQECRLTDDAAKPAAAVSGLLTVALPAPTFAIASPVENAAVNSTSVAVSAAAEHLDGRVATVTVSQGQTVFYSRDASPIAAGSLTETVYLTDSGDATGAALPDGVYTIAFAATDGPGNDACIASGSDCAVAVRLDRNRPTVTIVDPSGTTLTPPADPDSSTTEPGYQHDVTLMVDDAGFEEGATVCLTLAGQAVGCQSVPTGTTSVTFPGVTFQPGSNALEAVATDALGNVGDAASRSVTVVSDAPQVAVVTPSADSGVLSAGLTVEIEVRSQAGALATSGVTPRVFVNGVDSGASATDLGSGRFRFAVTLPNFGVNTVVGAAMIQNGIQGFSAPRSVNYKQFAPTVAVAAPLDGSVATLASSYCASGSTDCLTTVRCDTTGADTGSAASLTVTCGTSAPATATSTVLGDSVSFANIGLVNNKTCTLVCKVTDASTGYLATSSTISVYTDRLAPVVSNFVRPSASSLIFIDDASSSEAGFQYVVQGRVGGVEAGQVVTLTATWAGGSDTRSVTLTTPVADFQLQTVSFDVMTLPQGSVTLTITVSDAAGNAATPGSKTVTIASDLPLVRLSTPPAYVVPNVCTSEAQCPGAGECQDVGAGKKCALSWNSTSATSFFVRTVNVPTLIQNQLRICSDSPVYDGNAACDASGAGFNEVQRFDVSTADATVNINANLLDGVHTFTAEAKLDDAGTLWSSTITASVASDQTRLIVVDRTAPSVATLTFPDDTLAPSGCLNKAEGNGAVDVVSTCGESGTFRLLVDGAQVASASATANTPVTVVDVALPNGSALALRGECVDQAGNSTISAAQVIGVDTLLPTLVFNKPTVSPVLAGADRDIAIDSDELNGLVSLKDNGNNVGETTVGAGGVATFDHATFGTLSDGNHALSATIADACGNTKSASSIALVVDTAAPGVAITAPATGSALVDADDVQPSQGGFQVGLAVGTTGDAATYQVYLDSACASDYSSCTGPDLVYTGAVTNPGGAEPVNTLTLPISGVPEYVKLTVRVSDTAGNVSSASTSLQITLSACAISVSGLPVNGQIGNARCPTAGTDCASVDVAVTATVTGACGSSVESVSMLVDGSVVDTQPVVGNSASFTRTFSHNTQPSVDFATNTGVTSGASTYQVDLADPVPTFVATTVAGFVTPASGATVNWNRATDLNTLATGLQVNLRASVTDSGFGGGSLSSLTVGGQPVTPSSPVFPVAVTGTSFATDLLSATLPEGASQVVLMSAVDAAGNTASTSFTYSADTVPPAAVALSISATNRRRPSVTLDWTAVADDGATGTAAAAYDIRFGLSALSDANFDTACPAAELTRSAANPTPKAPGEAESYVVTGPDARSPSPDCRFTMRSDGAPYYFAVRAIDAAGNPGPITAGATTSSSDLTLRYAKAGVARVTGAALCTGASPTCDDDFDKRISAIGDVNNDGFDDFSVGGNASFGFCIHYGSATVDADFRIPADLAVSAGAGTNWQCFLDKVSGTLNEQKAGHVAQNPGDVNGDGLQDLAVPAYLSTNDPEIRIYFGTNGGQLSTVPDVVIKNFNNAEGTTTLRWGAGGDFNGDGRGDFILGARVGQVTGTADDNKAYLVPGNNTWAKVSGASQIIDLSNATTLTNNNVQTWSMAMDGAENPTFGANAGFVGNILTDNGGSGQQYDDIIVTVSYTSTKTSETKAIVIKGRPTPAAATYTLSTLSTFALTEDANTVVLRPDPATNRDFGLNQNIFRRDVTGDGIPDVLINHTTATNPGLRTLYVFSGAKIRSSLGATVRMDCPVDANNLMTSAAVGDGIYQSPNGSGFIWVGDYDFFGNLGNITDDPNSGVEPIAIAYRNKNDLGKIYVRFDHQDATTAIAYGSYPYVDLKFSDPYGGASFMERDATGVGDFNGDGYDDFVVSTVSGYAVFAY